MRTTLIDLFTSKKFLTAITAITVYLAGRFGFDVDTTVLDRVFAAFLVYVGAQGVADAGKGAATVNAAANAAWTARFSASPPAGLETGAALTATSPQTPSAIAGAAKPNGFVALRALLAIVGLGFVGLAIASLAGCAPGSTTGGAVTAGAVSDLGCETASINAGAVWGDLTAFGKAELQHWIERGASPSDAQLIADLKPIVTVAGRCAVAAAGEALAFVVDPGGAAGSSSAPVAHPAVAEATGTPPITAAALRARFSAARAAAGWPGLRLADGTAL